MNISYLKTLQRAFDVPGIPGTKEFQQKWATHDANVRLTNGDKVAYLKRVQIAMEANPTLTLKNCDKDFGLCQGTIGNFTIWLSNGRLPEASKELLAFFKMRNDTRFSRAAKASRVAIANTKKANTL